MTVNECFQYFFFFFFILSFPFKVIKKTAFPFRRRNNIVVTIEIERLIQAAWIITLFRVENSRVIRFIIFDLVFSNTLQLTDRGIVGQLVIGRITERAESGVTRSKGRWLSTRQMIERRFRQTTTCSVQIDNCLF